MSDDLKKLLIMLIGVCIMGANVVFAKYEGVYEKHDNFYYEIKNNELRIADTEGEPTRIMIPAYLNGQKVKKIKQVSFGWDNKVETIVISEGVEEIGDQAFAELKALKSIQLPKSLKKIGGIAFTGDENLESVTLNEGLVEIGSGAFAGLTKLRRINLPATLKVIGDGAFLDCINLRDVNIPKNLETLGNNAFANTSIESVVLPDTLTILGTNNDYAEKDGVFRDCKKLKSVVLPKNLEYIGPGSFAGDTALTSIEIPEMVVQVGAYAFAETAIEEITFPSTVTWYGYAVFENCSKLKKVTFDGEEGLEYRRLLYDCPELNTIVFNNRAVIYSELFENCPKLKDIIILNKNTRIKMFDTYRPLYNDKTFYIVDGDSTKEDVVKYNLKYVLISSMLETTVSKISDQDFTGKDLKPNVVVKDGNKTLVKGKDYTVTYKNNRKAGVGTVVIIGIGNYRGTVEQTFNIIRTGNVMPGDLNDDGEISLTDVLMTLKSYFNGSSVGDVPAADINEDGELNLTDVLMLLKLYFAKQ